MEPGWEINTVEDLIDYLIAEGETAALQKLRQAMEDGEGFDLDSLVISLAGEEDGDGTGQGT